MVLLSLCGDECSSYSDYTCKEIQIAKYNVYFYFPNDAEKYLGQVEGLDSCGQLAWSYADEKDLTDDRDWSYICCMIANGSSCYEKHR